MVVTVLNASTASRPATHLLDGPVSAAFSDVTLTAGPSTFLCHRAVLALHSSVFRDLFQSALKVQSATHSVHKTSATIALTVPGSSPASLAAAFSLIHAYLYGRRVPVSSEAALNALHLARHYGFGELSVLLESRLRLGHVNPSDAPAVFAAALAAESGASAINAARAVRTVAWNVLKTKFEQVSGWHALPFAYMVRLLKLNDVNVSSEEFVLAAALDWLHGNLSQKRDPDVAAAIIKLVRFPIMSLDALHAAEAHPIFAEYPHCARHVRRGLAAKDMEQKGTIRDPILEASPVYRTRRMDALTFSDRVASWSTVDTTVNTSARYFAGCVWNLVVHPDQYGVALYLGCLSEESGGDVDVEFDFSVFFVRHDLDSEQHAQIVKKQALGVRFSHSGQKAGFARLITKQDIENKQRGLLRNDTLFIGASIRLRGCKDPVPGFDPLADDTAEMLMFER